MSTARAEILRRIKGALRDVPADEVTAGAPIDRAYRRTGTSGPDDLVARFAERVTEYKAKVRVVAPLELRTAIAAACALRGARHLVVPADLPADWAPDGIELLRDEALTHAQLDESDGALTGCAFGIAQTGTIVLNGGPI